MTDEPKSSAAVDALAAAAVSLIPIVGGAVMSALSAAQANVQQRQIDTLERIVGGLDPQLLRERLVDDPAVQALFVNGVDYAARTGVEAKRKLLAKVVRAAIEDAAQMERGYLVTATLGQLDVLHIQALARGRQILRDAPGWEQTREATMPVRERVMRLWTDLPAPVLATLVATGCGKPMPSTIYGVSAGRIEFGPTPFGFEILDDLDSVQD